MDPVVIDGVVLDTACAGVAKSWNLKLEGALRPAARRSQGPLVDCAALWGEYRRALGPEGSRAGTAKVRSWVYTPLPLTLQVDQTSGYNVYKAHALGLGRGGGTPLCPFDCKCCY